MLLLVGLIWWQAEENIGDGGEEPNSGLSSKGSHCLNGMQMCWTEVIWKEVGLAVLTQ